MTSFEQARSKSASHSSTWSAARLRKSPASMAEIAQHHWQTLEVTATGDRFTISLDDRWALTVFDRNIASKGQVRALDRKGQRCAFRSARDHAARVG